jgi:biopolymer transport protein ExbD
MAASLAGGGEQSPEINVTPLIDVLLVLLIIFMVVLPTVPPNGLETQIPQPQRTQSELDPEQAVVVQVISRGVEMPALKINQENVTWQDLPGRLREIFKMRSDHVAFVLADGDLDFEVIANVIDLAHTAGVDHIGLMTNKAGSAKS